MTIANIPPDLPARYLPYLPPAVRLVRTYLHAAGSTDHQAVFSWQDENGQWSLGEETAARINGSGRTVIWVGASGIERITLSDGTSVPIGGDAPVNPAEPVTVQVPASAAPAATDATGTAGDTITLTRVEGIRWRVGPAGSYQWYDPAWFGGAATKDAPWAGGGTVEVSAVPARGYVLTGTAAWTLTFTNQSGPVTVTIPAAAYPLGTDEPGTAGDTITLTSVPGVIWAANGTQHPSSDFTGTKTIPHATGTSTTVTATAAPGYAITGTTTWTLAFTDAPSSEWTRIALFDAAVLGPDRQLTEPVTSGPATLKVVTGTVNVAAGKLVMQPGEDRRFTIDAGSTEYSRYAVEFTVYGRPEGFKRNAAFIFRSDFWAGAPFGIRFDDTTARFIQHSGIEGGNDDDSLYQEPRIPVGVSSTRIRMETNVTTGQVLVYADSVLTGTYTVTSAPRKPLFNWRLSTYSSRPASYGDISVWSAA